jgi:hypothetical protein
MLGKHHSQDSKAKMSTALKGRPRSEEVRRKISLGHKLAHKKNLSDYKDSTEKP